MQEIASKWIELAHSQQYDEKKAEALVEFAYELIGLPKPIILHADSPIGALLTLYLINNVWANVSANVRDNVSANVGDNVWDNVWDNVGGNVRDNVRDSVLEKYLEYRCYYINFSDFHWTSFFDFFQQCEFGFCTGEKWELFSRWKYGLESNIFECYTTRAVAICVRPPKIIKNESGLLHNPIGPAIEFRDGYKQYYINGRCLPSWIWEEKDSITKERFLSEQNAEIRGGMYAVLGQKRVFELIGAEEISRKYANNETYILYRTKEPIGEKYWQWVGVKCPSTATEYLLGVPHDVVCPIEAVAGTLGLSASEYIINQHT